MFRAIRAFLLVEAAAFAVAALVHSGRLVEGYAHREARIAETVLSAVLFGGLVLSLIWPGRTRAFGLAAQAFALLGTLVGLFTIVIGVGPRTVPDVIYHIVMVALLTRGLIAAYRAGRKA